MNNLKCYLSGYGYTTLVWTKKCPIIYNHVSGNNILNRACGFIIIKR